jgi:hypothetical protein
MTIIHAIQAWCVLNIGIYFYTRHTFGYARTAVDFLKSISKTPEIVNNNEEVLHILREVNIPPFATLFEHEKPTLNVIMFSLVVSAITLMILPLVDNTIVMYIIVVVLGLINGNTLLIAAQMMTKKMVIKKICNHYYNIVESCRLDKERNEQAVQAFQQFANRIQELLNNPDKKDDGSDE